MKRILLADDDDSFRKMLRKTLVKMGFEVAEANNGNEALKAFAHNPPDLVITDLVMPEKEGLETINALRRIHAGVKIIAMSGGGRGNAVDYLKVAKMLGADRVLSKPFSNEEIATALDELLGKG
jgi:CheY-like chemotaxis protein